MCGSGTHLVIGLTLQISGRSRDTRHNPGNGHGRQSAYCSPMLRTMVQARGDQLTGDAPTDRDIDVRVPSRAAHGSINTGVPDCLGQKAR
jgi:hypothetical protein